MAEVKLDDSTMRDVITAAILKTLTEESKALLIQQAIASLLTPIPKRDAFDRTPEKTKLQEIFDRAAYSTAIEVVRAAFNEDERVKTSMRELVAKGLEKALEDGELPGKLASIISEVFSKAASGSRY